MPQTDPLSTTFAALADPTRRAILARLAAGRGLGQGPGGTLRHEPARDLEAPAGAGAGRLIEQGRQAQWRPRRLRAGPLRDVADWVGQYRRHWEESFERLDAYFRDLKTRRSKEKGDDDDRDPNRPR